MWQIWEIQDQYFQKKTHVVNYQMIIAPISQVRKKEYNKQEET
jgi:hypothetical protein